MVVKRGGTGPHPTSKGKTLQWKMNRMAALIGEGTRTLNLLKRAQFTHEASRAYR